MAAEVALATFDKDRRRDLRCETPARLPMKEAVLIRSRWRGLGTPVFRPNTVALVLFGDDLGIPVVSRGGEGTPRPDGIGAGFAPHAAGFSLPTARHDPFLKEFVNETTDLEPRGECRRPPATDGA